MAENIDDLSKQFMQVVKKYDGEADTTTLRTETGMSKSQVQYRFRKLSDMGWIEVDRADEGVGERTPPKIAVLTEEGKQAIRKGMAGGEAAEDKDSNERVVEVSKERFDELEEQIESVETKVNGLMERIDVSSGSVEGEAGEEVWEELEVLQRDVDRIQRTLEVVQEAVQKKAPADSVESLERQVDTVEIDIEELKPIIGLLQIHMRAFKRVIHENVDGNLGKELHDVEQELLEDDEHHPYVEAFSQER